MNSKNKTSFAAKIFLFYIVTYLFTGIFFVIQGSLGISEDIIQLAQIGPALAAIVFILFEKEIQLSDFIKKGFNFKLSRFGLVMALIVPLIIGGLVSFTATSIWGTINIKGDLLTLPNLVITLSILFAALCEEIGWRGYLLNKLQTKFTPLKSTLILTILWGLWHVPKLMMGWPLAPIWFVGLIGLNFVLTMVFNKTNGNLWIATLLHAMANLTGAFMLIGCFDDPKTYLLGSMGWVVWAVILFLFYKKHLLAMHHNS